jgi:NADH dehydrogenase FAD-containing subunit
MTGIDRRKQLVYLAATYDEDGREITPIRSFRYDILVIAIGCVGNDFGTPGVNKYAIMLDTPDQAERFNRRLINACVRAYAQEGPIRPGQLDVAIIGAGATGTELAAELHQTARGVVAFGLDKIDPEKDIKITLIEAAPRILPALPEQIATAVAETLRGLHVDILTGSPVTEVTAEGVKLANGSFIPSELVVWAAGVKGPDVLAKLDGLEVSKSNQLVVTDTLQTTRDPNIFALGDSAYPAASAGRAPGGLAPLHRDPAQAEGRAATPVPLSRLRLARVARPLLDRRKPDGLHHRAQLLHRRAVRAPDVSLALQDARDGAARAVESGARYAVAHPDAPHRARRQAALMWERRAKSPAANS